MIYGHGDGDNRDKQKPMTDEEMKILKSNVDWTDDVHKRMKEKFPPEKVWDEGK